MEPPPEVMLAANTLLHRHGDGTEEYAAQQLWEYRQEQDKKSAAYWRSILEALKRVRELRSRINHGS
jgi:hypothetical protein